MTDFANALPGEGLVLEDTHNTPTIYSRVTVVRLTKLYLVFSYDSGRQRGKEGRVRVSDGVMPSTGEWERGRTALLWPTDPKAIAGLHAQGMSNQSKIVGRALEAYRIYPTDFNRKELESGLAQMFDYAERTRSEKAANA